MGVKTGPNLACAGNRGKITFAANLLENGTLSGYLSMEAGDMNWTAKRVDSKEKR